MRYNLTNKTHTKRQYKNRQSISTKIEIKKMYVSTKYSQTNLSYIKPYIKEG